MIILSKAWNYIYIFIYDMFSSLIKIKIKIRFLWEEISRYFFYLDHISKIALLYDVIWCLIKYKNYDIK